MASLPPLAMPPFAAGINNQRLAIAGLVLMASRQRRPVSLPGLLDYVAGQEQHDRLAFEEVFDPETFAEMLDLAGIELVAAGPDAVSLRPWDLFACATTEIRRPRTGAQRRPPLVHAAIAALRPRRNLARLAEDIRQSARREGATIGCQLRLEKDWQAYVERTLRARAGEHEDVELDHNGIFRKLADTFGTGLTLYVTCDENDLYVSKDVIARDALDRFGIRLLWKGSMAGAGALRTVLERSAIDFEVALGFDRFVGTTRSTFFNVLTYTKSFFEPANGWAHYPYNLRAAILVARSDAFTGAARAPAASVPTAAASPQEVAVDVAPTDEPISAFFRDRKDTPKGDWTDRPLIGDPTISTAIVRDLVGPTAIAVDSPHSYQAVISALHRKLKPAVYVEIGVNAGDSLRLASNSRLAVGVDPSPVNLGPEFDAPPFRIVRKTSDTFFEEDSPSIRSEGGVDFAFVDGLHIFEFVLRDFIGIERLSRAGGVTAIHDVLPRTLAEAARHRITRSWTGDVWRLPAVLQRFRPDLEVSVLDARPTGLALVSRLDPGNVALVERYDEIVSYGRGLNALDFLYRRELPVRSTDQWLSTSANVAAFA